MPTNIMGLPPGVAINSAVPGVPSDRGGSVKGLNLAADRAADADHAELTPEADLLGSWVAQLRSQSFDSARVAALRLLVDGGNYAPNPTLVAHAVALGLRGVH